MYQGAKARHHGTSLALLCFAPSLFLSLWRRLKFSFSYLRNRYQVFLRRMTGVTVNWESPLSIVAPRVEHLELTRIRGFMITSSHDKLPYLYLPKMARGHGDDGCLLTTSGKMFTLSAQC